MIQQHSIDLGADGASRISFRADLRTGTVLLSQSGHADASGADRRIERSIHYMMANLNRPLRIATLAAQASVSPSYLFALFKQTTGHAPMDYFTKLRMGYACELLDSSAASIKEVAAALGYDDAFYFSRVFKSLSAVAPKHYRDLGISSRQEIRKQLSPSIPNQQVDPGLGNEVVQRPRRDAQAVESVYCSAGHNPIDREGLSA